MKKLSLFLQPPTSISNSLEITVCLKKYITDQCGHKLFPSSIIPQDQRGQVELMECFFYCKYNNGVVLYSTSGYCKGIMFKQCFTLGISQYKINKNGNITNMFFLYFNCIVNFYLGIEKIFSMFPMEYSNKLRPNISQI